MMPTFSLLDFARASLDWLNATPLAQVIVGLLVALLYAYLLVVTAKRYAVWSVRREMRQLSQERKLKAITRAGFGSYVEIHKGGASARQMHRTDYPRDAA